MLISGFSLVSLCGGFCAIITRGFIHVTLVIAIISSFIVFHHIFVIIMLNVLSFISSYIVISFYDLFQGLKFFKYIFFNLLQDLF